jgi:hypothetical protein
MLQTMWTYLLGPFLAVLPRRWRIALRLPPSVRWTPAAAISGLLEFVAAVIAAIYWYSYSVTTWIDRALDLALAGKAGQGVTDHAIGFAALVLWAAHPLTWVCGYFAIEGAVRMCGAAFTDVVLGTFPLFVVDRLFELVFRRTTQRNSNAQPSNYASFVSAIREKTSTATQPLVADELSLKKSATEEILEIRACRRKEDWNPPRVVRYEGNYYRLELCAEDKPPRPFLYTLRRLPAGVPGRSVLIYVPN